MNIDNLTSMIPADLDLAAVLKFLLVFAAGILVLGFLGRAIFGKRSDLNHALSSAIGILLIYVITVVVYTFNPWDLTRFLSPLPFVTFYGDSLALFSFSGAEFTQICTQVLSLVILAFLVNLLDSFIPRGKKVIGWYLYRFLTVVLAMALHYVVTWAFNAFLPGVLVAYAPTILLVVLLGMLLIGVLKAVLGLVLTIANPIIGAIYTFFFASKIGKQLSKAVLTTLILCAVVYLLGYFGFGLVSITPAALKGYIPTLAVLLVLWYLIGHVL